MTGYGERGSNGAGREPAVADGRRLRRGGLGKHFAPAARQTADILKFLPRFHDIGISWLSYASWSGVRAETRGVHVPRFRHTSSQKQ
jgi:hypothetical protein